MHSLDGGFVLVDHGSQVFTCADSCFSCARAILWLVLGGYCKNVPRFFFWRPFGFRIRCRCIRSGTGSPGLGLSALLHSRCVLYTVLKVGTRMWERVCDQQHRHIGRLRRKGDVAWGATCVGFASLLEFLGSALCPTSEGLMLIVVLVGDSEGRVFPVWW